MLPTPVKDRVRVSITGGSSLPKINEKNVKQVLAEATETRRRSAELSERIKQFLAPMTLDNLPGSGMMMSKYRPKTREIVLPLKEDDLVEIINDIQDNNRNVMEVRVPRLETFLGMKKSESPKVPMESIEKRPESISDSPNNTQKSAREYKILKQLLKDTEESNRRSKELVSMMEKVLLNASKEPLVKTTKMKSKPKRVSDTSKSSKTTEKSREKRTSTKSVKTDTSKARPKTELIVHKIKRSSKVKTVSSTSAIKTPSGKVKRGSKTIPAEENSNDKKSLSIKSQSGQKPELSRQTTIKDMTDMIDAIGRRSTNNDEMRTYLTQLKQTVV